MMNAKFLLATAVVSLTLALQGCSLKQQNVRVDPEVKVQDSQVGNNVVIGLRVSDGRTDKKLGEVGDPNIKMVDVRTEEDPSPAIYGRVKQALTRLGYTVQPFDESMGRTLDIAVNKLELQSVKKPLTFDTELRAEVTAHAVNDKTYYDRQFNVRTRKDGSAPPYEKDSTALVNTALSQALEDLLSDDKLLALLAK
jgi:uncharacterized lipoprotein YajG